MLRAARPPSILLPDLSSPFGLSLSCTHPGLCWPQDSQVSTARKELGNLGLNSGSAMIHM